MELDIELVFDINVESFSGQHSTCGHWQGQNRAPSIRSLISGQGALVTNQGKHPTHSLQPKFEKNVGCVFGGGNTSLGLPLAVVSDRER